METYVRFRGHKPSVDALLRNRGLIDDTHDTDIHQKGGK